MGPARRVPGFTLIELLAALAVLAVLSSLCFRGLASVLDTEAHVRDEMRRWNEVALLLAQLREDISSAADARGLALGATDAGLALTRFAELPGAPPRRVGYRLREGTVQYLVWSTPGAAAPEGAAYPVLEGVVDLRFTALREDGSWTPAWPAGAPALPRAVAVDLVLARGERITRLYPLR